MQYRENVLISDTINIQRQVGLDGNLHGLKLITKTSITNIGRHESISGISKVRNMKLSHINYICKCSSDIAYFAS